MILYTLDIKERKKYMRKISLIYLLLTLFCFLFGIVYEYFSHEVYSNYMIFAFLFPLLGGVIPFGLISFFRNIPGRFLINIYNSGIATLTIGSIMEGVLEIYGTSNDLVNIYWLVGVGFVGISILLYIVAVIFGREK